MIGMVVSTWIQTGKKVYGDSIMETALKKVGWAIDRRFSPLEIVEDSTIKTILQAIADNTNTTLKQVWSDIGNDNLKVFSKQYPLFLLHDNVYGFLKSLKTIHQVIVDRIPGAKPPLIDIYPIGKREAIFTYQSKRGMFDYMISMLISASEHYGDKIEIETLEQTDSMIKLKLIFDKDILYKKKYWLNKFLTFGFIRKLEIKIAIVSILSLLATYIGCNLLNLNIGFGEEIIGVIISVFFIRAILNPIKTIKTQIDNLINGNYLEGIEIETGDCLTELSRMVNKAVDSACNAIISMEGVADEINEFNTQFEHRLENSHDVFKEITTAIEQVAIGASQQSTDIENTVSILNDNTISLKKIVEDENISQSNLEEVVKEINTNHKNIEETASNIQIVTEKFSELNTMSGELQNEVNEILNIVSTVTSIADETSLLSLNASIEAARAGESGKGFSVVAEEIRKLSSSSKLAATDISSSLSNFIKKINLLTQKVNMQFTILNAENNNLKGVATSSADAAISIDTVSKEIAQVIIEITHETLELEKIYSRVESLVAIGEENAAMSEEVSSSVTTYSEEVSDIVSVMKELGKITGKFSEGLSKYSM